MRRLLQRLALYTFHVGFTRPVLRWVVGVRYRKRHHAPAGPCLVVSNHNSHLDAAVLMTMFPLKRLAHVHPVAAADYFGSNWFGKLMAMLLMNGIPISRRPVRGQDPLAPIVELLEAGETLIFFPEGSRGEAGVVAKFRGGVGRLVQSVPGLLVVPVHISGPERIWPRGEVVPVPLSIDTNIGKPRTYPSLEDPREIADLVRRDVLALAPPPPPVPGERPPPPPRVALCGIDGASVEQLFNAVTARLGREGTTLGIADDVLEADAEGVREASGPLPVGRERLWLGLLSKIFRPARYRGAGFTRLVERAHLNEALNRGEHHGEARFIVECGSVVADLLAAASAGWGPEPDERERRNWLRYATGEEKIPLSRGLRMMRSARALWMLNALNLARATVPELLVLVVSHPQQLMRRLRSTGGELAPEQTEAQLDRLQQAYRDVAELLRRRRRVEIIEIDPETTPTDRAVEQILARLPARTR